MRTKEEKAKYDVKYAANNLKRVPLDLKIEDYNTLKDAAAAQGESINGFIKKAIRMRLDSLKTEDSSTTE